MTCAFSRLDVSRFFDGEMGSVEADAFRDHFPGCGVCGSRLESLMQLDGLLETRAEALSAHPEQLKVKRYLRGEMELYEGAAFKAHAADCSICGPALRETGKRMRLEERARTKANHARLTVSATPRATAERWETAVAIGLALLSLGVLGWLMYAAGWRP